MAFKYGPNNQMIEVPDAGNPLTLYYLGRALALLQSISTSDEQGAIPAPLKQAVDALVSEATHHVKTQCAPATN
jgi:hypothetical protein